MEPNGLADITLAGAAVNRFLSGARSGGRWDSEGFFTIDHEKAAGKLALSLLPDAPSWILKVVQAACRWNASGLTVERLPHALQLEMRVPRRVDPKRLLDSLTDIKPSGDPGLEHLSHGLRAVGMGQRRSWAILLRSQSQEAQLLCEAGNLTLQTSLTQGCDDDLGTQITLGVELADGEGEPAERAALTVAARTCAVPLLYDGQRLDDLQVPPPEGDQRALTLAMLWVRSGDLNRLRIPLGVRELSSDDERAPVYVPPYPEGARAARLLVVHYNYSRFCSMGIGRYGRVGSVPTLSQIHLVHDGVVVATRELHLLDGISVDLLLPAEEESLNLNGLTASLADALVHDAPSLMTPFTGSMRDLGRKLCEHQGRPPSRAEMLRLGAGWGTAFVLSPMLAKPLVGAGAALHWHRRQVSRERLLAKAAAALETFRGRLPIVLQRRA